MRGTLLCERLGRRRLLASLLVALAALPVALAQAHGPGEVAPQSLLPWSGYEAGLVGYDISWPQCPNSNFPAPPFDFAVIGVNDGRAMTKNECFAAQLAWARQAPHAPSLYLNTNSPPDGYAHADCKSTDSGCLAYHYGYEAATFAVKAAGTAAAAIQSYWLDVETGNRWSENKADNARVLQGFVDSLTSQGKKVGIYSTSYQFGRIAGSFAPKLPNWVPGVAHGPQDGPAACREAPAFGGGTVVMVQWTWTYDGNYACPPSPGPYRVTGAMLGSS